MARPVEDGIEARYRYQKVLYAHFEVPPGASLLLTADCWSYLRACLSQQLARGARGDRRDSLVRANYYAELAEGFYRAAEITVLPTKSTLVYYGVLNLAKCLLAVNRVPLESQIERHGLTLPLGSDREVQVAKAAKNSVNIFHEFAKLLGKPVVGTKAYQLADICSHIPEIHEIAFSLGHVQGSSRQFLPLQIAFLVNESKNRAFTEVRYEKKSEARVRYQRFHTGARAQYFRDLGERDGLHIFRSSKRKAVNPQNWPRIYRSIQREYRNFDLASILTHEGYRYYCDLGDPDFHHLSYVLMLMYYVGTIARYRPVATKGVMSADLRPLITEAVAVCPRQFLYQVASLVTKSVCAIPHSKLI